MMKRLATIAVVIAIVGSNVFAQAKNGGIARQVAMGGSNVGTNLVLNPFIMEDPALIFVNPAYQASYKDYGWMNIAGGALTGLAATPGTPDNGYGHQNAGLAFAVNNEWTLGMILSYDPSFAGPVASLLSGATVPGVGTLPGFIPGTRGAQTIPGIANVWELVAAYDAGEADFGFAFMYGSSNAETKTTTVTPAASTEREASSSLMGFRAGVNYDLGSGSSFDASAALRLDKATDDIKSNVGTGGEYSASGTEIAVNARAKFKVSNKFNFVPYASFNTISAEPKEDAFATGTAAIGFSEKVSAMALAVGVGGEFKTSTFYLAGGVSMQYAKAKLEVSPTGGTTTTSEVKYTALPVFNVGGEWWFTDWLGGRMGYYRALASLKATTENSATGTSETTIGVPHSFLVMGALGPGNYDGLVTLGLGLKFGGFALDGTVSEEALRRGFGLIGSQDNINTFGYLTASYNFE